MLHLSPSIVSLLPLKSEYPLPYLAYYTPLRSLRKQSFRSLDVCVSTAFVRSLSLFICERVICLRFSRLRARSAETYWHLLVRALSCGYQI